jgi:phosphatidylserine/phosphatidylglycerophosphate/cardiolipin synthase-like enzyme
MRLSTPVFSAFFNRRQQRGILFLRTVKLHPHARQSKFAAPIVFAAASMSTASNSHPSIDDLTQKLDSLAPRFELQTGDIEVLTTPEEFYSTLKKKILSSKRRVFLSSLYIGKEETELVFILLTFLTLGRYHTNCVGEESFVACVYPH